MEKELIRDSSHEMIPIYSLGVIQGQTTANVDELSKLLLENITKRYSTDPHASHFEDSYCPDSPIVDEIVKDMENVYSNYFTGGLSVEHKWGHIHEKNMSTNKHDHPNTSVSGVVYLSVPKGSGYITFYPNPLHDQVYPILPKKGMFLLFPAWIPHAVTRNQSNEPRVALSFNFKTKVELGES